jgi:hypothetical protein
MREFLRGGYLRLSDTTVVSNHGRPVFTVIPIDPSVEVAHRATVDDSRAPTAPSPRPAGE